MSNNFLKKAHTVCGKYCSVNFHLKRLSENWKHFERKVTLTPDKFWDRN